MDEQLQTKFQLIDSPLQMYALQSGHHLITVPFKDEDGQWVALRVEQQCGDRGTTIHLSVGEAVRLAKRLLSAADGNGAADMFFECEDIEARIFE